MARPKRLIGDLAVDVLRAVEQEQLVKTAAPAYISGEMKTEAGQLMHKLADEVRDAANGSISYADLNEFRKRYDV